MLKFSDFTNLDHDNIVEKISYLLVIYYKLVLNVGDQVGT